MLKIIWTISQMLSSEQNTEVPIAIGSDAVTDTFPTNVGIFDDSAQ